MTHQRIHRKHTGYTESGCVHEVRIQRIGRVTIYQRGKTYCLYYREHGKSIRRKVEGNLATARALASNVQAAVESGVSSPLAYSPIDIPDLVNGFIEYCELVRQLAPRTVDRYRAASGHIKRFAEEHLTNITQP